MTDSTHALHTRGDHSLCDYLRCEERQAGEAANADSMHAKAALFAIRRRGGNAKAILGGAYASYRELAKRESPEYLPQKPSPVDLIKANMLVREAMKGIPVTWEISDPAESGDFDMDAFFDKIYDE